MPFHCKLTTGHHPWFLGDEDVAGAGGLGCLLLLVEVDAADQPLFVVFGRALVAGRMHLQDLHDLLVRMGILLSLNKENLQPVAEYVIVENVLRSRAVLVENGIGQLRGAAL